MQRSEALTYLKEILNQDRNISANAVSFEKHNNSRGYMVRIRLHNREKQAVRNVAAKHSLTVEEAENEILIYKP